MSPPTGPPQPRFQTLQDCWAKLYGKGAGNYWKVDPRDPRRVVCEDEFFRAEDEYLAQLKQWRAQGGNKKRGCPPDFN